jgi:Beta-lactamase enzyme family
MKYALLAVCFILASCQTPIKDNEELIESLMQSESELFQNIIDSADHYEVQIIYTQINRNEKNIPIFKSYYFNFDSSRYFYPASTVKFPSVLVAFEKLNQLNIPNLDKYTTMLHDSVYSGQLGITIDTTSESNLPSIAHYAKKILIVSDNDAYNRLYEFIGQKGFNESLNSKDYSQSHILHRLERPLSVDENMHTEAIRFIKSDQIIHSQPMLINNERYVPDQKILKGKGYMRNDSLIKEPFDFSYKNFFPLNEQQRMLKSVIFPASIPASSRFNLTSNDRQFLLQYMSQLPRETLHPAYNLDTTYYTDAYCKFFMFGGNGSIPSHIRIFNKVGDAYGYLIDNAYIVDFKNGVEFMLSAVIHVNSDGIYNDGKYEYIKVGFPFFKNLGNVVYEYELTRNRKHKPNLSEFVFKYDRQRNTANP